MYIMYAGLVRLGVVMDKYINLANIHVHSHAITCIIVLSICTIINKALIAFRAATNHTPNILGWNYFNHNCMYM